MSRRRRNRRFPTKWTATAITIVVVLSLVVAYYFLANSAAVKTVSSVGKVCYDYTKTNQPPSNVAGAQYNEQTIFGFKQDAASLEYNVTATTQSDQQGYGPLYSLNGLTSPGYWYQVGITWNWVNFSLVEHVSGFEFFYQVYNQGGAVFPSATGASKPAAMKVNPGDTISLSLKFEAGNVSMLAFDYSTRDTKTASFYAFGAQIFTGSDDAISHFTGIMTEWYHVNPHFCSESPVTYSSSKNSQSSIWMETDEWNFTGVPANQRFNKAYDKELPYNEIIPSVTLNSGSFKAFSYLGTTVYASPNEFVTF